MSDESYAEMIEIPVSSCEMVFLPKKRKKKNLRKQVITKVNAGLENESEQLKRYESIMFNNAETSEKYVKPAKKKKGFDIISAQIVAVFVLIVAILVTNIFWEDSGINNLIKNIFQPEETKTVDTRDYKSFALTSPSKTLECNVENGVMRLNNEGAVYAPTLGVVSNISELDGKYTVTITHSDKFKTIIRNADYTYFNVGETVYNAVPVCYSADGKVEILMFNDNTLLTNYALSDGNIVWQS